MKDWNPGIHPKSVKDNPKGVLLRLVIALAATLNVDVDKLAKNMQTKNSRKYAETLIAALDGQLKTRYEEAVKALTKTQ